MTTDFALDDRAADDWVRRCPAYAPTPVVAVRLPDGRRILAKDARGRFGLGSFKALGGACAVARLLDDGCGPDAVRLDQSARRDATFVCASAGNHGLSVAAGARLFGARARVPLSAEVPEAFAERLRAKDAAVIRSGRTYEESVAAAAEEAAARGFVHLADGSWAGYTAPPRLVMEGYAVIGAELRAQLAEAGDWPSDVFLQAGVGGLAAAVASTIRDLWPVQPRFHVVEPDAAPCIAESLRQGRVATVSGGVSEMGRLDCKTASLVAVALLRGRLDGTIAISDAEGRAAAALARGWGLASTSSGAAGLAGALRASDAPLPLVILTEAALA